MTRDGAVQLAATAKYRMRSSAVQLAATAFRTGFN
jgi:hypothetical protein